MGGEFTKVRLGDLVSKGVLVISDGYRVRNEELGPEGIPFVRGGDIGDGWINTGTVDHVRPEFADRVRAKLTRPGDVAFITKGTVGRAGRLRLGQPPVVFAPQVAYWRVNDLNVLDPGFLFYLIRSRDFQSALDGVKTHGSMVADYVSISQQHDFRFRIPDIATQRAVAHILSTLDDKIELNRRMNETLEAMARALFKSWFVDFDPVHAKAKGRDPELPRPIAALFPDSFEDSELGEKPEGWGVRAFSDTLTMLGGGTPRTSMPEYWNGEIPWFSVVDAPSNAEVWVIDTEKKITQEGVRNSSTRVLPVGTTIISARGTVGRLALVGVPMAMNQSCYALHGQNDPHGYYTYFMSRQLVSSLQQQAHGSVFDTITRDTLASVNVIVPRPDLLGAFGDLVHPFMAQIRANLLESRTLAALRDTLLPKLISGELRVKEGERAIRECV